MDLGRLLFLRIRQRDSRVIRRRTSLQRHRVLRSQKLRLVCLLRLILVHQSLKSSKLGQAITANKQREGTMRKSWIKAKPFRMRVIQNPALRTVGASQASEDPNSLRKEETLGRIMVKLVRELMPVQIVVVEVSVVGAATTTFRTTKPLNIHSQMAIQPSHPTHFRFVITQTLTARQSSKFLSVPSLRQTPREAVVAALGHNQFPTRLCTPDSQDNNQCHHYRPIMGCTITSPCNQ